MSLYQMTENWMTSWDETELFYRAWLPEQPAEKAVIIFHRGHEHSGRLFNLVEALELEDCAVFAWDARGNGKSPGPRDYADSFSVYVRDADAFVKHIAQKYAIAVNHMAVIGNSVGGVIAATWVHDYAPPIRALVLAAPAFRIKLYVPFAIPVLRLALKLGCMRYVTSYVKAKVLTHDKAEQASFNHDPQITHSIATNILLGVYDTATRIVKDAGAIRVPTLLLMAGSDWVVKNGAQKRFFENLSAPTKKLKFYKDYYHAIFHENGKEQPILETQKFIREQFEHPIELPTLTEAHTAGFTKNEFEHLKRPSYHPFYWLNRIGLSTVARLSRGVQLGWKDGFDSGVTLDYVYRNQPAGITPIGKLIDYCYLNNIGWKGIRVRKIHLNQLLSKYIDRLSKEGKRVHIVDIAGGPGRYILDAIKASTVENVTALVRDYKSVNIEQGREIARAMQIDSVDYQQGDAFDRESLAQLNPKPTLAVISGLFELIPDNEPIMNALNGLSAAMDTGSFLVYTNQPWHPQVEYIARVLTNREGDPWIMRRRTTEEMDALVAAAGFEKIEMLIDEWGIFSVSVASKAATV